MCAEAAKLGLATPMTIMGKQRMRVWACVYQWVKRAK
jgi:hypothetical protein